MKTYTADQLVSLDSEQISQIQTAIDNDALALIEEKADELSFLDNKQLKHLKEYYTDTMEKYRLIYEAIVAGFTTPNKPGFPEFIYNINLKSGNIEKDKNGRNINYSTEILAPCTTAMLHYINNECNNVYVIIPPIKGAERTIEKIIFERTREHSELVQKNLAKFELPELYDEPELPFPNIGAARQGCPTKQKLNDWHNEHITQGALLAISRDDLLPKDIYRMSITSKYPGDLEELIKELTEKFPEYVRFEEGEHNLYKKNLSENKRNYFDIKKTARIKIPGTQQEFYIEFQFKQTNMFFAHIRSHSAYEEFRILEAKYLALKKAEDKKKSSNSANRAKLAQLKKQCEEKTQLCLNIHRNAVHQSNLYLMHKLLWLDDNARGLHRPPENDNGQYQLSIEQLKKNYIVESYEPFDGATAFTTGPDEYLNKSYYLKLINLLPESFDELGKNAREHINKTWSTLTPADIKDFNRITAMAIKYQNVIRSIQKERRVLDNSVILQAVAQEGR